LGTNHKRRKSNLDEDEDNLFVLESDDGYSIERKQRLIELNDPDSFDHVNLKVSFCIYTNFLQKHLHKLKNGEPVSLPEYDFDQNVR